MTPQKLNNSHLLASTGDWFQDFLWIPKLVDAQVPYIKWHRTIYAFGSLHPWIPNRRWKIWSAVGWLHKCKTLGYGRPSVYLLIKFTYKWTLTVQTHVFQGSVYIQIVKSEDYLTVIILTACWKLLQLLLRLVLII